MADKADRQLYSGWAKDFRPTQSGWAGFAAVGTPPFCSKWTLSIVVAFPRRPWEAQPRLWIDAASSISRKREAIALLPGGLLLTIPSTQNRRKDWICRRIGQRICSIYAEYQADGMGQIAPPLEFWKFIPVISRPSREGQRWKAEIMRDRLIFWDKVTRKLIEQELT